MRLIRVKFLHLSNKRKKGMSLYFDPNKRFKTKSYIFYHCLIIIDFNLRSRRGVDPMTILTIVGGLASLGKAIYEIVTDYQERKKMETITQTQEDLMKISKENIENFISLSNINYNQDNLIKKILCENISRRHQGDLDKLVDSINQQYLKIAEKEILSIMGNQIPQTLDFIKDFSVFCDKVNKNKLFCSRLSFSPMIEFTRTKLKFEKDAESLILKTEVLLPIMAPNSSQSPKNLYQVRNIGFFKNNQLLKLKIPDLVVKSDSNDYFFAMNEPCSHGVCPINGLLIDNDSQCISSLFSESTENCKVETLQNQNICKFIHVPNYGSVVTASSAEFTALSSDIIAQTKSINNETKLILDDGTLRCENPGFESSHPLIAHSGSTFSLRTPELLSVDFDMTDFELFESNQKIARKQIDDLENFYNRQFESIGNFEISKPSLVLYGINIIWALLFSIFIFFHCKLRHKFSLIPSNVLKNLK